jgi:hypothetical protein
MDLDRLGQPAPDLLRAPDAMLLQAREPRRQGLASRVYAEANDMHRPPAPGHRDLDAGDQVQVELGRGGLGLGDPGDRIVIRQGHCPNAGGGGASNQVGGGEGAVGRGGVGVEIRRLLHRRIVTEGMTTPPICPVTDTS